MSGIIEKSFGGLTRTFYTQHFIWGFVVGFFFIFSSTKGFGSLELVPIFLGLLNTFLYPYSRFGLESGMNHLFGSDGNEGILFDVRFILLEKFVAIIISWFFALIIAPFSLIYIYKLNNK